jgi:hypothetical protein
MELFHSAESHSAGPTAEGLTPEAVSVGSADNKPNRNARTSSFRRNTSAARNSTLLRRKFARPEESSHRCRGHGCRFLDKYLEAPRAMLHGTKMTFGRIMDTGKRGYLIAYLATLK